MAMLNNQRVIFAHLHHGDWSLFLPRFTRLTVFVLESWFILTARWILGTTIYQFIQFQYIIKLYKSSNAKSSNLSNFTAPVPLLCSKWDHRVAMTWPAGPDRPRPTEHLSSGHRCHRCQSFPTWIGSGSTGFPTGFLNKSINGLAGKSKLETIDFPIKDAFFL